MSDIREVLQRYPRDVAKVWADLLQAESFDFRVPVFLCDDRTSPPFAGGVKLSALGSRLGAARSMEDPLWTEYQAKRAEMGDDLAFEEMASDDDRGRDFCALYDEARAEVGDGAVVEMDALVRVASEARDGFAASPREMVVVWVRPREGGGFPLVSYGVVELP